MDVDPGELGGEEGSSPEVRAETASMTLPMQMLCRCALHAAQVLWTDPLTQLPTMRHDVKIDRGMSFEAAVARLQHERSGACAGGRAS